MKKKMEILGLGLALAVSIAAQDALAAAGETSVQLGPRPFFLVDNMDEGELKDRLSACSAGPFRRTDFSIGHRGAAMQFPEHTLESYRAAARMGAGIVECDVTFTADKELVCRHSQCDLHTTTNILATPLAEKCSVPPVVQDGKLTNAQEIKCCTSDITLAEFKGLKGKMDGADKQATSLAGYLDGTAGWRTDLYTGHATLMTHKQSVELFKSLGVKMTPELKAASVGMPFSGDYSQARYAQQLVDEYKAAGVDPSQVFLQSFNLEDIRYWIEHEPAFGAQAVYLDDRDEATGPENSELITNLQDYPANLTPSMDELAAMGVRYIAPPMWALLTSEDGRLVPSAYAKAARQAGLKIITWTLERSDLRNGANAGTWYHQTTHDLIHRDSDRLKTLDTLAREVGIVGIFSDWPATVTYYANCMKLN